MRTSNLRLISWLTVFSLLFVAKPSFSANPVSITLLAAGDIAQCGLPGAAQTAALIEKIPGTVLAVGDLAYPKGTHSDFARCYAPTWGKFKSRTLPVPGNHDYQTPDAAGYFDYFGKGAGEPGKGYYSVDKGGWHIVALNSNIEMGANSEQVKWLRDDLAANRHTCFSPSGTTPVSPQAITAMTPIPQCCGTPSTWRALVW